MVERKSRAVAHRFHRLVTCTRLVRRWILIMALGRSFFNIQHPTLSDNFSSANRLEEVFTQCSYRDNLIVYIVGSDR